MSRGRLEFDSSSVAACGASRPAVGLSVRLPKTFAERIEVFGHVLPIVIGTELQRLNRLARGQCMNRATDAVKRTGKTIGQPERIQQEQR